MEERFKDITILYVEDDASIREGYTRTLKRYCNTLFTAKDGDEGLQKFESVRPDIVISDINMPNRDGLEMAKEIKQIDPKQPIIFTTAYSDSQYTVKALELQVEGYLLKPVDKKKLKQRIEQLAKAAYLEKENKKQQLIIDHIIKDSSSIIILTDCEDISFASNTFYKLFNISSTTEFFTKYKNILEIFASGDDFLHAQTKEDFLLQYEQAPEDKRVVSITDHSGSKKAYTIHIEKVFLEQKSYFLLNLTDISKIQEQKKNFEYQAYYDPLTKIANRARFEEMFKTELLRYERFGNKFCVAILDIDHFKRFNDTHGHLVGDEMLIQLAKTVTKNTRELDCFARWGGEEFVLLMPQTSLQDATNVCEGLRKKIASITHEVAGGITASFGVSIALKGDTLESFFKRCDEALYQAKKDGRNCVVSR